MYTVGDKVVYPMHGAGVIEKIEEKKILGETRKYYILKLPCGDMKVMIPVENSNDVGVREIISEEELKGVLSALKDDSSQMPSNWNRRYRENMEKLKTGDVMEVAEVVRNLVRMDRQKKLSTGEKKMLTNAKQILLSEIILVRDIGQNEANDIIDRAI
ncbi:CarD family transcriptional regulator [Aminipila luticellarii]|uniref:CarD family transcriptional regulator n=1 Tax=Aminipila luticellarii TaxID=2507160 RepID=A0A410PX70_9FIRM|nr:CarD family transcriptional regulator [Aminipila luticellarii]QAT43547.1 CarD family transcriptional regulator [Aminipila luticellarii]